MKTGIYKIINKITGQFYIGHTKNFQKRKAEHLYNLRKDKHVNIHLQRSWNKYGEDSFEIEMLLDCKIDELYQKEKEIGEELQCLSRNIGYNIRPFDIDNKYLLSDESKKRMSLAKLGKKRDKNSVNKSVETRKTNGYSHTNTTRIKMSKSALGNSNAKGQIRSVIEKQRASERMKRLMSDNQYKTNLFNKIREVRKIDLRCIDISLDKEISRFTSVNNACTILNTKRHCIYANLSGKTQTCIIIIDNKKIKVKWKIVK